MLLSSCVQGITAPNITSCTDTAQLTTPCKPVCAIASKMLLVAYLPRPSQHLRGASQASSPPLRPRIQIGWKKLAGADRSHCRMLGYTIKTQEPGGT